MSNTNVNTNADNQPSRVRNDETVRVVVAAGFAGSFDQLTEEETFDMIVDVLGIRDKLRPIEVDDLKVMIAAGFNLFKVPDEAVQ